MPSHTRWRENHLFAAAAPNSQERIFIALLDGLVESLNCAEEQDNLTFPDSTMTSAFGQVIEGIGELLNLSTGRLDPGTIDGYLHDLAARIGWCRYSAEVEWDCKIADCDCHARPT